MLGVNEEEGSAVVNLVTSPWMNPIEMSGLLAQRLRPIGMERSIPAGETVIRQGEVPDGIYLLLEGRIKQYLSGPNGEIRSLMFCLPGCLIGDVPGIDGLATQVASVAETPVRALYIPRERFAERLAADAELAYVVLLMVTRRLRAMVKALSDATSREVPEQLSCLLHQWSQQHAGEGRISLAISHQELAELLGVSRVTVSQCLAQLRARGVIETGHREIHVLKPDALRCCGDSPYCLRDGGDDLYRGGAAD